MNLTIIEEDIFRFNKEYFYEIGEVAEDGLEMIDANELIIPEQNYTIVTDFLIKTMKNFRVMDSSFASKTLKKLDKDLRILKLIYAQISTSSKNTQEVFNLKFVKSSKHLYELEQTVAKITDAYDRKEKHKVFVKLKSIYYDMFEEIFNDDRKYFLSSLKQVINSRTYYYDRLLWVEAMQSNIIQKHFQILKIKGSLNTRNYLLYTTGLMRPYTKEFEYLQSCLRIYK